MKVNPSATRAEKALGRAKRFPVQIPVRYRIADSPEWLEARTENVSYTGVLFRTKSILKPTTNLEVRLELPPTKGDGGHPEVVCKCQVVRVDKHRSRKSPAALAVAIQDYRLTRTPQPN
ncbi:MAG: PilZ domain-containing protein [Terriglobia bacterium]